MRIYATHVLAKAYPLTELALKNPPKKTHIKKPTKNGFFGFFGFFFKFLIFYENNTNFSLSN
jgi:hypothetical protein